RGRKLATHDARAGSARASEQRPYELGLLVALTDRAPEADLTIVDPDIEPAIRAVADPCFERDGRTVPAVVGQGNQLPFPTLPALRQLEVTHRAPLPSSCGG